MVKVIESLMSCDQLRVDQHTADIFYLLILEWSIRVLTRKYCQVSWIRHSDVNILSLNKLVYTKVCCSGELEIIPPTDLVLGFSNFRSCDTRQRGVGVVNILSGAGGLRAVRVSSQHQPPLPDDDQAHCYK